MNEFENPGAPLGPSDAQIARMHAAITAEIAADAAPAAPRRRGRGWLIGGTLGLLVLLAGGTSAALATGVIHAPKWFTTASAPDPVVTHEPVPAVSETPTQAATPTPTPTKPAVFSSTCEQLVPSSLVASISPYLEPTKNTPSPQGFDGTGPDWGDVRSAWGVDNLGAVGQGYSSCQWNTMDHVDLVQTGTASMLALSAIPQSTIAGSPDRTPIGTLSSPDRPQVTCSATAGDGVCTLSSEQDGVVFSAQVWVSQVGTPTLSQKITDELTAVLRSGLTEISTQGAVPTATVAPSGRWVSIKDCSEINVAVREAQPGARVETNEAGFLSVGDGSVTGESVAANAAGFSCQLDDANGNGFAVQVLPGLADAAWQQATAGMTPLTVAGTSAAVTMTYENSGSIVVADVDGALVMTGAPDAATAAKLMAAIAQRTAG